MSFYDILSIYKDAEWGRFFNSFGISDVEKAVAAEEPAVEQFACLLSPAAGGYLEETAERAHRTTLKFFGKTIQLYTPLYLSNYCENQCLYCGFNSKNDVERRRLTPDEVEKEAIAIASTGLKHILVLTGESRRKSPVSYIIGCVKILKKYFSSIAVEVYALTEDEYAGLVGEGVDGLTIYQETYDEKIYAALHGDGPKRDYRFRLDAPERAARAGMRSVNIGVLLGLDDWRKEAFLTGLHAKYLQDKFPEADIGVSLPRLRPQAGGFEALSVVNDKDIVQMITALRIFLPRLGIAVSTREDPQFRENIIPLGITRMSAGSSTRVGGHASVEERQDSAAFQFEISDKRNVKEVMEAIHNRGYQPVLKDWAPL